MDSRFDYIEEIKSKDMYISNNKEYYWLYKELFGALEKAKLPTEGAGYQKSASIWLHSDDTKGNAKAMSVTVGVLKKVGAKKHYKNPFYYICGTDKECFYTITVQDAVEDGPTFNISIKVYKNTPVNRVRVIGRDAIDEESVLYNPFDDIIIK